MMAQTIWKFEVQTVRFTLSLPQNAQFLSVQTQHGVPQMWFLLDPERTKVERRFAFYGTGHEVPNDGAKTYLGTFQLHGGSLVFHLFEYE